MTYSATRPAPSGRASGDRANLYDEITDRIIAELEAGRLPWVQPWGTSGVAAPLALPKNAATSRRYSGINVLILWGAVVERGYAGQSWLTFRQALALGGSVRKGERGTTVVYADRFIPGQERQCAQETGKPETPYQRAAQAWDERIGSARVQARNWRLMALGELALIAGLAAALVWQSARGTIVPWVVQVDRLGEAQAVAPAIANFRPTDPQIAWHLARFIEQVRGIAADPIIVRQNWLRAYDFATDRGALALNDFARASDPFGRVGRQQVAVEVSSVIRASDDSFRVAWIERTYENGQLARTERWTAILTIVVQPARDAERLRKNPLGIFVHAINWSRELGQ